MEHVNHIVRLDPAINSGRAHGKAGSGEHPFNPSYLYLRDMCSCARPLAARRITSTARCRTARLRPIGTCRITSAVALVQPAAANLRRTGAAAAATPGSTTIYTTGTRVAASPAGRSRAITRGTWPITIAVTPQAFTGSARRCGCRREAACKSCYHHQHHGNN